MTVITKQQSLDLAATDWLSSEYFVTHSGVTAALEQMKSPATTGFHLSGPPGSGKSHFIAFLGQLYPGRFLVFDWSNCDIIRDDKRDDEIRRFIAAYEDRKKGGLEIIVVAPIANPHVSSRMSYFSEVSLALPQDNELLPLINSVLERRNIRIESKKLERLISRLPANPLSLAEILTKIDDELASTNARISSNFHKFV